MIGPAGTTRVAGIDSSTQSCKVVVVDLATGETIRRGRAAHPPGTVIDPERWWDALLAAVADAGGFEDVSAISVSAQQHSPVFIGADGGSVRDSLLWNDTGAHPSVVALNAELGHDVWIRRTGLPITLSDTVSKLRWLRDNEPDSARSTVAVAVVHDWLTWRLAGGGLGNPDLESLTTDRSDASGTGYWSGETEDYCWDLLEHAFGKTAVLPRVLGPTAIAGHTTTGLPGIPAGLPIGVGAGDNAAAALALHLEVGDAVMSLGTSGVVYARSKGPVHDYSGVVCSYADGTGDHLPLAATLNAARDLDAAMNLLGCTHQELSELALAAPPGADGLTLLPYFEGERTPDLPQARASLHGASLSNFTRPNLARATYEGMLSSQMVMLDATRACGVPISRLFLIGGAARSAAARTILAQLVDVPLVVPKATEYVAIGAAMQATAALTGSFPAWPVELDEPPVAAHQPVIRSQHDAAKLALGYPVHGTAGPLSEPQPEPRIAVTPGRRPGTDES
jgi:xylulokinase